jgi:hypothetical protein
VTSSVIAEAAMVVIRGLCALPLLDANEKP